MDPTPDRHLVHFHPDPDTDQDLQPHRDRHFTSLSLTPTITPTPSYNHSPNGGLCLGPNSLQDGDITTLFFDAPPLGTDWWVYTLQGEMFRHFQTAGPSQSWKAEGLASGLYFVRVRVHYQDGHSQTKIFKVLVLR